MDIFDSTVLTQVVAALPPPNPFILDTFFKTVQTENAAQIHFDVDTGQRRVAPFVSPLVAGQVVRSRGFKTQTFEPAYIKDKRIFDSRRALKRTLGERIGGTYTPINRLQAVLAQEMVDQVSMLTLRQEVMAAEALRTGKIIISGEQYPTAEVDFGRDPALTQTLTGTSRWGEPDTQPLRDIQRWAALITQKSGAKPDSVIMDVRAWQFLSADPEFQTELDRFRSATTANPAIVGEGGRLVATIGDLKIYVYSAWYEDPGTGDKTPVMPDHTVIITSEQLEGTRAYGAIRDEEAGYQALPYFVKSWTGDDPGVRYLLMQSAPLPVPYRINASFCATVA